MVSGSRNGSVRPILTLKGKCSFMLMYFSRRLCGDILSIHSIIQDIIRYLGDDCGVFDESDLFELKVILNELLLNAVKYGAQGDLSKYVKVTVGLKDDDHVFIAVEDSGQGCDYKLILDREECRCTSAVENLFEMCETGRGMWIVKNLSDKMYYNKKGNRILVTKKLYKTNPVE